MFSFVCSSRFVLLFSFLFSSSFVQQECKYQGLAREGGQDTLQKKIE